MLMDALILVTTFSPFFLVGGDREWRWGINKGPLTPKALRGPFWAFGVFGHGPLVSILLQFL